MLLSREREARREAELAADRSARLQRVTAALSAASSADAVGEVVVGQAIDDFYAAAGALAFRVGDEVQMRHDRGFEATAMAAWRRFPLHMDAPVCDALRTGEPVYLETLDDWERYPQLRGSSPAPSGDGGDPDRVRRRGVRRARPLQPRGAALHGRRADFPRPARRPGQPRRSSARGLYEERAYVARTLQQGLLPERLAEIPGLEVAVRYHSIADGGTVGGDFYDCFDIRPDRWLVVVGDVAGKGTAAAVLTALARHTVRAIALRDEPPEDVLRFLNEALRRQAAEAAFCTVGCVRPTRRPPAASTPAWPPGGVHTRCWCARAAAPRRSSCAARCSGSRPARCSSR